MARTIWLTQLDTPPLTYGYVPSSTSVTSDVSPSGRRRPSRAVTTAP